MSFFVVLSLAAGVSPAADAPAFATGIALTPRHFPHHTADDVKQGDALGREAASLAIFISQWSEPDCVTRAGDSVARSRAAGLSPVISISPTKLANRGELDVPDDVRAAAGRNLSFANPSVEDAFAKAALQLAKLKPPYLCLATEINFLALAHPDEYRAFAVVCRKLYPKIKAIAPDTKVFVSFQWDVIVSQEIKAPGAAKIAEQTALIDLFRPLDVIAFTSYPSLLVPSVAEFPANFYDGIAKHVKPGDKVVFTEIGWPSGGKSSEEQQLEFVRRLPRLMAVAKPEFVAWALLHDVDPAIFPVEIGSTGLRKTDGTPKAAWAAFKALNLTPSQH